jgi:hypothetical protein
MVRQWSTKELCIRKEWQSSKQNAKFRPQKKMELDVNYAVLLVKKAADTPNCF